MQSLCVPHRGLFSLLVSILCQALRRSYVHEVTAEVSLAEQLLFKACGGNKRIGIDAGAIAHVVEHIDKVFSCQVSGRSGCEGASAQTAECGLTFCHAGFDGGKGVDHAHVARVVDVDLKLKRGKCALYGGNDLTHLRRVCKTDCIAQVDLADPGLDIAAYEIDNGLR